MDLFTALEWVRSRISFSNGTLMDMKYYNGLKSEMLAFDAPSK
jgi:hypothetical protein